MKRILVLRGGALGDLIVMLPALALLRQTWPEARIELAGNATAAVLALDAGLVNRVHSQHEARWATLYGESPLPGDFARTLADFDLVLNFWPDPDGDLQRRFPFRPGQIYLTGAAMPTRAPAAAHYCEPLRALGLTTDTFWHRLASPSPDAADANLIAIHPGSGSPRKNWPLAHWESLCAWLVAEHHASLLIITGEAESAAVTAGTTAAHGTITPPTPLHRFGQPAHNLPLPALVQQLSRCRLFLGHDSGISHLAAACGVPSLLLFGPTDPALWAPPAPQVRILKAAPDLGSLSVASVQQVLAPLLSDRK